jgi:hypothetical protein
MATPMQPVPRPARRLRRRVGAGLAYGLAAVVVAWALAGVGAAVKTERLAHAARTAWAQKNVGALVTVMPRLAFWLTTLRDVAWPGRAAEGLPWVGPRVAAGERLLQAGVDGIEAVDAFLPVLPRLAPFLGLEAHGGQRTGAAALDAVAPALPLVQRALPQAAPALDRLAAVWPQIEWSLLPARIRAAVPNPGRLGGTISHLAEIAGLLNRLGPALPALLGLPHPVRYMLLFQNSGEIRATGGFITAYGYLVLNRAVPEHLSAYNIYHLDPEFHPDPARYQPPQPLMLHVYLPWPVWHLRDSNVSPDVPTFAHTFYRFYDSIPHAPPVDGLILVDTWLVDRLLADVGGIRLPAWEGGVTLTAANANVEMEYVAEQSGLPQSTRKAFVATVMKQLWTDVLHARGQALRHVLGTLLWALNDKYLVPYVNNPLAERALIEAGWAGAMDRHVAGDYLQVVDENLNGHKDNFAIEESVVTRLQRRGGRWWETTTVQWVNPAVGNGWMFVDYRAWIRLYVPRGSKLVSLRGYHGLHFVSQNGPLDKTVFNAHILMGVRASPAAPPTRLRLTAVYLLPRGLVLRSLTLQKQPGARPLWVTIQWGPRRWHFLLTSNRTVRLP